MGDDIVRRAVKEATRRDLKIPLINELVNNLSPEQLLEFSSKLENQLEKQLPWLNDLEAYYFEVTIKDCECVERDEDGDLLEQENYCGADNCQDGQIFQDSSVFEQAIKAAGGLAISIGCEILQAENDFEMDRVWSALKSKPLFVRHLDIDPQWLKYVVIYPAPKE